MKKKLNLLLILILLFSLSGCSNLKSLDSNYSIIEDLEYTVSIDSDLSLIPIDYEETKVHLLGYNNDSLDKSKEGSITSFIVGKNCISITSSIMDLKATANKKIMLDLLYRLNKAINSEDTECIKENKNSDTPYIISKNNDFIFIDYITTISNIKDKVIYYRMIIQPVENLNLEVSDKEYNSLPDYLPELLKILGIEEDIK